MFLFSAILGSINIDFGSCFGASLSYSSETFVLKFCICNLTLTVSSGIVILSAKHAESAAAPAFLRRYVMLKS